jgi:hypothetical protein
VSREKISATIRALRAKTVENGCTEAEAIAAAELLAKLLEKHNMTLDEAELRESPFTGHREQHEDEVGERLWKVADGIAHLTGARYWVTDRGRAVEINFFGFAHEVDVASYLLDICARAMRQEHRRLNQAYALLVPARRRRRILPFLDGMADRLRQRLKALKPPAPTGKGLVVLHSTLVEAAMAERGIKLKTGTARGSRDFEPEYGAGRRAADRVALNPGVTGSGRVSGWLRG